MATREHDRHLDQHTDHRGQGRARVQAEQGDGHGHRQFKKLEVPIRHAGPAMLCGSLISLAIHQLRKKMPVGLQHQGNGNQANDQRLVDDGLRLKAKQQNHRGDQPNNRPRLAVPIPSG